MRKYEIQDGFPKGIKMALIPLSQLERLLEERSDSHLSKEDLDVRELVSSLAIELWRLEKRIEMNKINSQADPGKNENPIADQVQRIRDVFKKHDIETHEYTGVSYNDGLSLKVLHVEEMDSIPAGKMQVIETVKPSVYFKSKIIFHGEVIIGKSKERE